MLTSMIVFLFLLFPISVSAGMMCEWERQWNYKIYLSNLAHSMDSADDRGVTYKDSINSINNNSEQYINFLNNLSRICEKTETE